MEDLLGDENLAALEAGQEGEELVLDSLELEDPGAKPKKKGKAKAAAKTSFAKKPAKAGPAKASVDMEVCATIAGTPQCNASHGIRSTTTCIPLTCLMRLGTDAACFHSDTYRRLGAQST